MPSQPSQVFWPTECSVHQEADNTKHRNILSKVGHAVNLVKTQQALYQPKSFSLTCCGQQFQIGLILSFLGTL